MQNQAPKQWMKILPPQQLEDGQNRFKHQKDNRYFACVKRDFPHNCPATAIIQYGQDGDWIFSNDRTYVLAERPLEHTCCDIQLKSKYSDQPVTLFEVAFGAEARSGGIASVISTKSRIMMNMASPHYLVLTACMDDPPKVDPKQKPEEKRKYEPHPSIEEVPLEELQSTWPTLYDTVRTMRQDNMDANGGKVVFGRYKQDPDEEIRPQPFVVLFKVRNDLWTVRDPETQKKIDTDDLKRFKEEAYQALCRAQYFDSDRGEWRKASSTRFFENGPDQMYSMAEVGWTDHYEECLVFGHFVQDFLIKYTQFDNQNRSRGRHLPYITWWHGLQTSLGLLLTNDAAVHERSVNIASVFMVHSSLCSEIFTDRELPGNGDACSEYYGMLEDIGNHTDWEAAVRADAMIERIETLRSQTPERRDLLAKMKLLHILETFAMEIAHELSTVGTPCKDELRVLHCSPKIEVIANGLGVPKNARESQALHVEKNRCKDALDAYIRAHLMKELFEYYGEDWQYGVKIVKMAIAGRNIPGTKGMDYLIRALAHIQNNAEMRDQLVAKKIFIVPFFVSSIYRDNENPAVRVPQHDAKIAVRDGLDGVLKTLQFGQHKLSDVKNAHYFVCNSMNDDRFKQQADGFVKRNCHHWPSNEQQAAIRAIDDWCNKRRAVLNKTLGLVTDPGTEPQPWRYDKIRDHDAIALTHQHPVDGYDFLYWKDSNQQRHLIRLIQWLVDHRLIRQNFTYPLGQTRIFPIVHPMFVGKGTIPGINSYAEFRRAMDFGAAPSRYETFCLAGAEYIGDRTPVICTSITGFAQFMLAKAREEWTDVAPNELRERLDYYGMSIVDNVHFEVDRRGNVSFVSHDLQEIVHDIAKKIFEHALIAGTDAMEKRMKAVQIADWLDWRAQQTKIRGCIVAAFEKCASAMPGGSYRRGTYFA